MAARPLKEFKYGIYILIFIVCILVYDFYNNYNINPDIWSTEWFRWRVAMVVVLLAIVIVYGWLKRIQKGRLAQQEFTKKFINAQEYEWKQIASELHDSVGQYLTFAAMFRRMYSSSFLTYARCFSSSRSRERRRSARCGTNWL